MVFINVLFFLLLRCEKTVHFYWPCIQWPCQICLFKPFIYRFFLVFSVPSLFSFQYQTICFFFLPYGAQFSSVQFSRSVVSDSLRPHELQHARPPCPSPTPGVHSDSRASSRWCHPAISSSVVPFSSCPQSLPASGSFPVSQLFAWGGQSAVHV